MINLFLKVAKEILITCFFFSLGFIVVINIQPDWLPTARIVWISGLGVLLGFLGGWSFGYKCFMQGDVENEG